MEKKLSPVFEPTSTNATCGLIFFPVSGCPPGNWNYAPKITGNWDFLPRIRCEYGINQRLTGLKWLNCDMGLGLNLITGIWDSRTHQNV